MGQSYLFRPHRFDSKYKTVVRCELSIDYMEKVYWANENSNGQVAVFYNNSNGSSIVLEFAFEDVDDALIFKIQYSK